MCRVDKIVSLQLRYAGREVLGVPAVGVGQVHQQECQEILQKAFGS